MSVELTREEKEKLGIIDERIKFYFMVENEVIENTTYFSNCYEKLLFITLARYCNNGSVAFASCETLAQNCCCTSRTIIKTLKSLVEKGLIKKVERSGKKTNLYAIQSLKTYTPKDKKFIVNNIHDEKHSPVMVNKVHSCGEQYSHNKELTKNNYIKNTTTTNNLKIDEEQKYSSTIYDFLDLKEFEKLNTSTKNNIRKHIKNLTDEQFRKIYNHAIEKEKTKAINNFNAFIFNALKNNWNLETFEVKKTTKSIKYYSANSPIEKSEYEIEKEKIENELERDFNKLSEEEKNNLKSKAEASLNEKAGKVYIDTLKKKMSIYENTILQIAIEIMQKEKQKSKE